MSLHHINIHLLASWLRAEQASVLTVLPPRQVYSSLAFNLISSGTLEGQVIDCEKSDFVSIIWNTVYM